MGSIQVTLNISHTYDSDLFIFLQAPDGTEVLLVNRRGGSGHNFVNTVLSDAASQSIRLGVAPFTGTFQPESPLSTFAGKDARGVWTLWVEDEIAGDVGVINSWSLTIVPASGGSAGVSGDLVRALTKNEPAPAAATPIAPTFVTPPHRAAAMDARVHLRRGATGSNVRRGCLAFPGAAELRRWTTATGPPACGESVGLS